MLKRAQCQVAREHQQTMASVVLGCRGCHQTRECGSGCQGAPTGWQMWCQAVSGYHSSPRKHSSLWWWGCSISLREPSGKSAGSKRFCGQQCSVLPQTSPDPLLQPCLHAWDPCLLLQASQRAVGSHPACLTQEHLRDAPYASIPMAARAPGIMNFSCA